MENSELGTLSNTENDECLHPEGSSVIMSIENSKNSSDDLINYMREVCPLMSKWAYPNISENKFHQLIRHFRTNVFFYLFSPMMIYLLTNKSNPDARSITLIVGIAIFSTAIVYKLLRDLQATRVTIGTVSAVRSWVTIQTRSVTTRKYVEFASGQTTYKYYCSNTEGFNLSDRYFLELNVNDVVVGYRLFKPMISEL